jgi:Ca2+-binding RTX toxin-like protein
MVTIGVVVVLGSAAAVADDVDCSTDPCRGTPADDHIDGTDNAEVIKARAGNDEIDGLDGADTLYGGGGDDLIDASSDETAGSVDTVDCGSGLNDGVSANENDVVSSNCETIFRVPDATVGAVESAASSSSDSTDDEQEKAREEFLANNQ